MSVEVQSDIKPINDAPFPVTQIQYVKGGYMSVATTGIRDFIYPFLRATGMLVHVQANNTSYRLVSGVSNANWLAEPIAGYTHFQSVAATSWIINHNLGYNPTVAAFYVSGQIFGSLSYPTGGSCARLDFNQTYVGTGYCS